MEENKLRISVLDKSGLLRYEKSEANRHDIQ